MSLHKDKYDDQEWEQIINYPPEWAEHQIWYQIFLERFYNGDKTNDPTPTDIVGAWPYEVPQNWSITPWTQDWYKREDWQGQHGRDFNQDTQLRRYGGDLQGVLYKLDYLKKLGVTAIYVNPLNDAPSLHKYDAASYHHIDVNFGPDPEGDKLIINSEIGHDSTTWKWTAADQLFLQLIEEIHDRGMRIILDVSWNHTGLEFWAWKDILQKQTDSYYADWYNITTFKNQAIPDSKFTYEGWQGLQSLPEWKKINVKNRQHGSPYNGNLQLDVKHHIFEVTKRWLAPNGEPEKGIDGFRLDVADQIPMGFWREYRQFVKSIKKDAYLVGEIWWKEFPEHLMDPKPYLGKEAFDAVMFYQAYRPARGFFGDNMNKLTAHEFQQSLLKIWDTIHPRFLRAMMSVNSSHDTPRLLTSIGNKNNYKELVRPSDNPTYHAGKPSSSTIRRTKLYLLHQYTSISSPHIWNGDEMGMWGADDPDCRKPLWWPEFDFEAESSSPYSEEKSQYLVSFNEEHFVYYQQLITLRKKYIALQMGTFNFLELKHDEVIAYYRLYKQQTMFVAFNMSENSQTLNGLLKMKANPIFKVGGNVEFAVNRLIISPMTGVVFINN